MAVKLLDDRGKPTPMQIFWGFNHMNVEIQNSKVEIEKKFENFTLSIDGLVKDTEYTAYLIGGSAQPGYPDMMAEAYIIQLPFKTALILAARLDITNAVLPGASVILLLWTAFLSWHFK